jgi:hypothetical protein
MHKETQRRQRNTNRITMTKIKLRIKNNKPEYYNPLSVPDSKAWEEIPRLCAKF